MPRRFFQKVVQLYLKPRIKREISDNWDPKDVSDPSNLVENWLLPWREVLGDKEMQGIFLVAKLKLSSALSHPGTSQALIMQLLLPWRPILDHSSFEALLTRTLIPRLTTSLRAFEVDPSDQQIEPITSLFAWQGVLPDQLITQLLRDHVLTKWLTVLQDWLDQLLTSPVEDRREAVEEIIQWYLGWKSIIPGEIRERPEVEEVFRWALEMLEIRLCFNNS